LKLITRDTDYAIRALVYIAERENNIISITELVEKLKIPRPFLRKILQILNTKRIIKSFKGKNGGFRMESKPENILLTDLMEIFQGKFKLTDCLLKKNICPNKADCILRKKLVLIESYVENELKKATIKSMMKGE
jgi:Rrf2 family protein